MSKKENTLIRVVYTTNLDEGTTQILCYTAESRDANMAVEDYSLAWWCKATGSNLSRYVGDDRKEHPVEDDRPFKGLPDGYYLRYDDDLGSEQFQSDFWGDTERINVIENVSGVPEITGYFGVQEVNRFLDQYIRERTPAVLAMEANVRPSERMYEKPSTHPVSLSEPPTPQPALPSDILFTVPNKSNLGFFTPDENVRGSFINRKKT